MPDVDGSFTDPDSRKKVFVSLRPGESSEMFAARAMNILFVMSDILPIERVVMSGAGDWEKLRSSRWLEARHRTDEKLWLRLTTLRSDVGGAIGHLVVDWNDHQLVDSWGDLREESVYLPRTDTGTISTGWAFIWRLVHDLNGLGDEFDACFEQSGILVKRR